MMKRRVVKITGKDVEVGDIVIFHEKEIDDEYRQYTVHCLTGDLGLLNLSQQNGHLSAYHSFSSESDRPFWKVIYYGPMENVMYRPSERKICLREKYV